MVSTHLKKAGLQTFNPCGKVGLSQENKTSHLLLRETLARYPVELWKSVVYSDEIFRTDLTGRVRVRRQRGTRHKKCFTVADDSSCQDSVHCWGWIDGHGNGDLHRIEGHLTPTSYGAMLQDMLGPPLKAMRPRGRAICPATRQCSPAHGAAHKALAR